MTQHAGIFSSEGDSGWSGGVGGSGRRGWGGLCFTPSLSVSSFALLPQLISSSGFSVEHLALRRSRGWGSVTFDEWIHLWLTLLLSDCLILSLSLSVSLSCSHLLLLWTSVSLSFWPLLLAQDSGCWFNWIVLNSGSQLHLLWSSQRLRLPVKFGFVTLYEHCFLTEERLYSRLFQVCCLDEFINYL